MQFWHLLRNQHGAAKFAAATVVLVGVIWLWQWWQIPPAVEFDNLKYIQLLRTAVSSERTDWLGKVKLAIDERCRSGEMSPQERSHFDQIIAMAETNNWKAAHEACFRFEVAQLNRHRRSSTATHGH